MSKSRVIGAGAGIGRANGGGGYNTGGNQGGGNKKQGLIGTTNMRVGLVPYVRTRADGGNSRHWTFCMNQLGGVGRRWGQAAGPGNRGGVHALCKHHAAQSRQRHPRRPKQSSGYGSPKVYRSNPVVTDALTAPPRAGPPTPPRCDVGGYWGIPYITGPPTVPVPPPAVPLALLPDPYNVVILGFATFGDALSGDVALTMHLPNYSGQATACDNPLKECWVVSQFYVSASALDAPYTFGLRTGVAAASPGDPPVPLGVRPAPVVNWTEADDAARDSLQKDLLADITAWRQAGMDAGKDKWGRKKKVLMSIGGKQGFGTPWDEDDFGRGTSWWVLPGGAAMSQAASAAVAELAAANLCTLLGELGLDGLDLNLGPSTLGETDGSGAATAPALALAILKNSGTTTRPPCGSWSPTPLPFASFSPLNYSSEQVGSSAFASLIQMADITVLQCTDGQPGQSSLEFTCGTAGGGKAWTQPPVQGTCILSETSRDLIYQEASQREALAVPGRPWSDLLDWVGVGNTQGAIGPVPPAILLTMPNTVPEFDVGRGLCLPTAPGLSSALPPLPTANDVKAVDGWFNVTGPLAFGIKYWSLVLACGTHCAQTCSGAPPLGCADASAPFSDCGLLGFRGEQYGVTAYDPPPYLCGQSIEWDADPAGGVWSFAMAAETLLDRWPAPPPPAPTGKSYTVSGSAGNVFDGAYVKFSPASGQKLPPLPAWAQDAYVQQDSTDPTATPTLYAKDGGPHWVLGEVDLTTGTLNAASATNPIVWSFCATQCSTPPHAGWQGVAGGVAVTVTLNA